MLAQRAAERKTPPVMPKRPPTYRAAHTEGAPSVTRNHEDGGEDSADGRQSNDPDASPRHVRKLPPGAFNLAVPLMAQMRTRSNTVATDEPQSREGSLERDDAEHHQQMEREAENERGSREALDTTAGEAKTPKRPPPPVKKRSMEEKPPRNNRTHDYLTIAEELDTAGETTDSGNSSLLQGGGVRGSPTDPSALDYDQVLSWSPAEVASWLTSVGLGGHSSAFIDKEILGSKLLELDNSALKV